MFILVHSSPVQIPSPYQQANSCDQYVADVLPAPPNVYPPHGVKGCDTDGFIEYSWPIRVTIYI